MAEHYLAAVVERAAGLATALAVAAGLLAEPDSTTSYPDTPCQGRCARTNDDFSSTAPVRIV